MDTWARDKNMRPPEPKQSVIYALAISLLILFLIFVFEWVQQAQILASRHTIAFIPQTTGTELWEAAHVGAQIAGQRTGFRVYWNAPTRDDDVQRQIELIDAAVKKHDAGLIVAPIQYLALISPLREALARHIPVAVVSTSLPLPPGNGLVYLLSDDETAGRLAARRLGSLLQGRGTIAILGINPNLTALVIRAQAFEATMAAEFPAISIVDRRAASPASAEAGETAQDVLLEHPGLDAVFGLNSTATEGALTAVRLLHKTPAVRIVGCDQELDLMEGIRQGEIDAIIVQNSYSIGFQAVTAVAAERDGQTVAPQVLVPPLLVTRDNINTPEVQSILSVNWRIGQ